MPARHLLFWICGMVCAEHALRAAVVPGAEVVIRVYETAAVEPAIRHAALREAGSALAAAGIDVRWELCRQEQAVPACARPMSRGEFTVRIVRQPAKGGYRGSLPLGDALVDVGAQAGVLATVYLDRVEWLASAAEGDAGTLLGRAMAHELGHLLLATTTHSESGLMRAVWSREEIRRARRADWTFTDAEIAALQVRRRGVPLLASR